MGIVKLAPHEAIEVHELISQKILGIKKVSASIDMVTDVELKIYMQDTLSSKKTAFKKVLFIIKLLENFIFFLCKMKNSRVI